VLLGLAPRLERRLLWPLERQAHVVRLSGSELVPRGAAGERHGFPQRVNQGLAPSSVHARMASPVTGDSVHGIPPHFLRKSIS
jgi:hypothetical protein